VLDKVMRRFLFSFKNIKVHYCNKRKMKRRNQKEKEKRERERERERIRS
jgi:hypothetical protein